MTRGTERLTGHSGRQIAAWTGREAVMTLDAVLVMHREVWCQPVAHERCRSTRIQSGGSVCSPTRRFPGECRWQKLTCRSRLPPKRSRLGWSASEYSRCRCPSTSNTCSHAWRWVSCWPYMDLVVCNTGSSTAHTQTAQTRCRWRWACHTAKPR